MCVRSEGIGKSLVRLIACSAVCPPLLINLHPISIQSLLLPPIDPPSLALTHLLLPTSALLTHFLFQFLVFVVYSSLYVHYSILVVVCSRKSLPNQSAGFLCFLDGERVAVAPFVQEYCRFGPGKFPSPAHPGASVRSHDAPTPPTSLGLDVCRLCCSFLFCCWAAGRSAAAWRRP